MNSCSASGRLIVMNAGNFELWSTCAVLCSSCCNEQFVTINNKKQPQCYYYCLHISQVLGDPKNFYQIMNNFL